MMSGEADAPFDLVGTLALWESLVATSPPARAAVVLMMRGLAVDMSEACERSLAAASAAALAELRERSDAELATVFTCPHCGALLDVPLPLRDLAESLPDEEAEMQIRGVVVRTPTTVDALAAAESDDPAGALRERLVTWGDPALADDPDVAAEVAAAVERLAGAAGISIHLSCPGCDTASQADLDIARLLVDRVTDQAYSALAEIASLARAFGWPEADIVTMSPARRQAYLALAESVV